MQLSPDTIRRTAVREDDPVTPVASIHLGLKGLSAGCGTWNCTMHFWENLRKCFMIFYAGNCFFVVPSSFSNINNIYTLKPCFKMQNHAKDTWLVPCRAWNPDFAPWLENGICMTSPDTGSLNIETMWLVLCHQNSWLRLAGKLRTQSLEPGPHLFHTSACPHTFVPRHLRLLDPVSWCSSGKASRSEMPAGAFSKVRAADTERQNQKMLCLLDPQQQEWY